MNEIYGVMVTIEEKRNRATMGFIHSTHKTFEEACEAVKELYWDPDKIYEKMKENEYRDFGTDPGYATSFDHTKSMRMWVNNTSSIPWFMVDGTIHVKRVKDDYTFDIYHRYTVCPVEIPLP